ncbi:nitrite reductase (NADH) small subunit [Motilibacter peucedani]|uniref:Nitrite reductase (NADH) small subunit n=1 Tax=Motilibacter peucedani TaxID=598650 RepID=A0A420XU24_9ACTN|nr:nitrite reductase small subunit NirD [Motilibacter peucedani]RKS80250.1 nitrite reductase (NADH) small subunit [Motilibacter peucedani]
MTTLLEPPTTTARTQWLPVCRLTALLPERGAAALLGATQVALFRLSTGEVVAVGNRDPFSGSNVISRGIVGTRGSAPVVSSPMHKQAFDLRSGICLDAPDTALPTYPVRVTDGVVEVALVAGGRDEPTGRPGPL